MKKIIIITSLILLIIVLIVFVIFNRKSTQTIDSIKHFSFHFTTGYEMNSDVLFEINCEKKCLAKIKPSGVSLEDIKEIEVREEVIKEVLDVLNKYNVASWNGFNKTDPYVLDGNSFSLNITTITDKHINVSGYMKWPKNYREVKEELQKIYEKLLRENI